MNQGTSRKKGCGSQLFNRRARLGGRSRDWNFLRLTYLSLALGTALSTAAADERRRLKCASICVSLREVTSERLRCTRTEFFNKSQRPVSLPVQLGFSWAQGSRTPPAFFGSFFSASRKRRIYRPNFRSSLRTRIDVGSGSACSYGAISR